MSIPGGWLTAILVAATTGLASTGEPAVAGRVSSADGSAISGATVEAFEGESEVEAAERRAAGRARTPIQTTTTAADGSFRLDSKRPFAWLQASADSHAPASAFAEDGVPAQLTLKRVPLRRGVVTAAGRPVGGAVVYWISPDGAERMARTSPDGSFEAPEPKGVQARIVVLHPDFAPLQDDAGAYGQWLGLDRQLHTGVRIAGTVVDHASGRPVADAQVLVDAIWPLARTDAKGAFVIPRALREWTSVAARTARLAGVTEKRSGALVVRMKPARTLMGTVSDRATRQPLAGATVMVATSSEAFLTATTDERGQYVLQGLTQGRYHPYVTRDGYAAAGVGWSPSPREIDLRTAASARYDASLTRLPRVHGRVEDDQHRPVEGALVALISKGSPNVYAVSNSGSMAGNTTRTGADGSFTLAIPVDGESSHESSHSRRDRNQEQRLAVMKHGFAAAQAAIDARESRAAPVTVTLSRGVELQGRISDPQGRPVAGVAVTAAEQGSMRGGLYPTHMMLAELEGDGWLRSDEAGRFSLRVQPVAHHLSFRKPGYAPRLSKDHDPGAGPLDVVLDPAAAIRGRVSRADGRGVADAMVFVGFPLDRGGRHTVVTSADGAFEIADLSAGVYQVRVHHDTLGFNLTRIVEAPTSDLQMVLGPAVTLRGRVVDAASRQPVPRFKIAVTSTGEQDSWNSVDAEDPAGEFVVEDVAVGEGEITVSAEGYADRSVEGLSFEQGSDPPPLEILLEADAPIRGRVAGPDGAPVADASVGPHDGGEHATTDEDGEYEIRGLPAGETTLTFQAQGYVPEKRTIDSRESSRLDVTMKRGLILRGEVLKAGVGVPNVFVAANSGVRGATYQSAQTGEQGRFTIEGLVPGRYTVSAEAHGQGSAKLEDVDAETAGPLRLTLDKAATAIIHGRVVGVPEGDAGMTMVTAMSEETGESAEAPVDSAHAFRIEDAPAGRVQVRAHQMRGVEGFTRSSRTVDLTVAPGSETETVLEFASDIAISGVVTRDGGAVPFVSVSFRSDDGGAVTTRADARGSYQAVGLEPGLHQVSVSGDDVSYEIEYVVTASAELDIDVTGGSISGRVVRADGGAPVPGVEVSFFRLGRGENKPDGSTSTGSQGSFQERAMREGRYRLITSKAGYGQEVREVEVTRGGSAEILIELAPADGVGVTVVDARDSRPLEAIVVVRDQARRIVANAHSGADDSGQLNIPVADGSYLLSTSASGYGTVTIPVTAPTQGLRVGLTPGGTLVIESERSLRGRVRLIQPDGEEYVRCWCNGIGEIQLKGRRTSVENVTPGSYTVEIVDSPEATTPRPVLIREGQTSTVAIE